MENYTDVKTLPDVSFRDIITILEALQERAELGKYFLPLILTLPENIYKQNLKRIAGE